MLENKNKEEEKKEEENKVENKEEQENKEVDDKDVGKEKKERLKDKKKEKSIWDEVVALAIVVEELEAVEEAPRVVETYKTFRVCL